MVVWGGGVGGRVQISKLAVGGRLRMQHQQACQRACVGRVGVRGPSPLPAGGLCKAGVQVRGRVCAFATGACAWGGGGRRQQAVLCTPAHAGMVVESGGCRSGVSGRQASCLRVCPRAGMLKTACLPTTHSPALPLSQLAAAGKHGHIVAASILFLIAAASRVCQQPPPVACQQAETCCSVVARCCCADSPLPCCCSGGACGCAVRFQEPFQEGGKEGQVIASRQLVSSWTAAPWWQP
jgi:hypothetical protein